MQTIHLHAVHLPKKPNRFLLSVGDIVWSFIAIFFFILSRLIGDTGYQGSIGGNISLTWMVGVLAIVAILVIVAKPER